MSKQKKNLGHPLPEKSCVSCIVSQCAFTDGLGLQELIKMDDLPKRRLLLKKGVQLFNQGDKVSALYVVTEGIIKSYLHNSAGQTEIIGFHIQGEVLGLESLHEVQYMTSALSLSNTILCEIALSDLYALCGELPSLQANAFKLCSKQCMQHVVSGLKRTALQSLVSFLLNLMERYHIPLQNYAELDLLIPRYDIANYLQLTAETVSRLFAQLQDEKLIAIDNKRIRILDALQLKAIAIG